MVKKTIKMKSIKSKFEKTLPSSDDLYAIIMQEIWLIKHQVAIRNVLTKSFSGISFEHSNSIMLLMTSNNYTTAVSLLRLQYEAVANF